MPHGVNGLGRLIDKSGRRIAADPSAKRLFSNKQVLGRFVKACLPEYHDLPLETVIRECFEDDFSLQGENGFTFPLKLPEESSFSFWI